jgi:hypothetical protein
MKYIKSYKLFESVGKIQFPTYTDLHDFFIELEDDEITKFNYKNDMAYLFFPQRWDRPIQSQLYFDMSFEDDFINHKPKELMGETWSDFFMDPLTYPDKKFLRRKAEWIYLDDVEEKRTNVKQLSGEGNREHGKTFEELFVKKIEKGVIKAYPTIYCTFDIFEPKYLDDIIERLKMVYEATDYRPLYGFWKEDFADEESGNIVTLINSSLCLVNVTDEEYKNLILIFNDYDNSEVDKQVTKHFI